MASSATSADTDQARTHYAQEAELAQLKASKAAEGVRALAGSEGSPELQAAYAALCPDSETEMHDRSEVVERAVVAGFRQRMLRGTKASDFRKYLRSLANHGTIALQLCHFRAQCRCIAFC